MGGASTNYLYGTGDRLSSWTGGGQYEHDSAGCVTNIVRAGGRTLRLEWDSQYRVKAVYTNSVLAERYGYDALGRRAWIGTASTTNRLVYDGLDLVALTDAAGNLQRTWMHGPGIDDVLSMTVHGAQTNITYTYIKDHQNTVLALVDDAGAVVERYDYDAWGNVRIFDGSGTPISSSALGNPFTFQGREISWTTGLINFRARWYDPETGRWLSNDPIGISGGLNQYEFVANNPVIFVDPYGLVSVGFYDGKDKGGYILERENGKLVSRPIANGNSFKNAAEKMTDIRIDIQDPKEIRQYLFILYHMGIKVTAIYIFDHGREGYQQVGDCELKGEHIWGINQYVEKGTWIKLLGCSVATQTGIDTVKAFSFASGLNVEAWTGLTKYLPSGAKTMGAPARYNPAGVRLTDRVK